VKSLTSFAAVLLVSVSSFAYLTEDYTCVDASGSATLSVSTKNRPDFDFTILDTASSEQDISDIRIEFQQHGASVETRLIVKDYVDGISVDVTNEDRDGKTCFIGSRTEGIKLNLQIGGSDSLVPMTCALEMRVPQGAIECE